MEHKVLFVRIKKAPGRRFFHVTYCFWISLIMSYTSFFRRSISWRMLFVCMISLSFSVSGNWLKRDNSAFSLSSSWISGGASSSFECSFSGIKNQCSGFPVTAASLFNLSPLAMVSPVAHLRTAVWDSITFLARPANDQPCSLIACRTLSANIGWFILLIF